VLTTKGNVFPPRYPVNELVTVSELLREGTPIMASSCCDSRPGDTERYDGHSARLEEQFRKFKNGIAAATAADDDQPDLAPLPKLRPFAQEPAQALPVR
jgi:hypothetical protein